MDGTWGDEMGFWMGVSGRVAYLMTRWFRDSVLGVWLDDIIDGLLGVTERVCGVVNAVANLHEPMVICKYSPAESQDMIACIDVIFLLSAGSMKKGVLLHLAAWLFAAVVRRQLLLGWGVCAVAVVEVEVKRGAREEKCHLEYRM